MTDEREDVILQALQDPQSPPEKQDPQDPAASEPPPPAPPSPEFSPPAPPPARPGKKVQEDESVPLWLITFTDIMALMLTFFVLMYSMSNPDEEEWKKMTQGMSQGLSKFQSPAWYSGQQADISIDKIELNEALDLNYLRAVITSALEKDDKLSEVVLFQYSDRLVISLPHHLLFGQGKADIVPDGKKALYTIGALVQKIRNRIEVVGHAGPGNVAAISNAFSSSWELSLARALSVAALLDDIGYTRPAVVRGLSSARYDELSSGLSEEKRLDIARRVEIVIMKDDGSNASFVRF